MLILGERLCRLCASLSRDCQFPHTKLGLRISCGNFTLCVWHNMVAQSLRKLKLSRGPMSEKVGATAPPIETR